MKRRDFLLFSSAIALSGVLPKKADALLRCGPWMPPGVQQCEAGINSSIAHITAAATGGQHFNQWCWAACIEMVFRYYGHPVSQERIVYETFGGILNWPGNPNQIMQNLNRQWVDNSGNRFMVQGDARNANPITASQDLAQNMPLIIGTMGHAMVLTSLVYIRDQFGNGETKAAIVRDPWPKKGRRVLTPQEWYNTSFLARIRVY